MPWRFVVPLYLWFAPWVVIRPPGILAAELRFHEHRLGRFPGADIRGAAVHGRTFAAWGDRVLRWTFGHAQPQLFPAAAPYSEAGAIADVNGDGRDDLILAASGDALRPPELVWLEAPDWKRHLIARGVDTHDILPATILGHRGVIVVHRQIRFYEIPADPAAPWPAQDLYSFYTPSREGGLALADIDGDGLPDILCGNDWIRSPKSFDLHWRLFAIDTWNEEENSAMLRLAWRGGTLVAGQREMSPARLAWFEKPAGDPTPQWPQHPIAGAWSRIHSVDLADFTAAGKPDLLVGDESGVYILRGISGTRVTVATGPAVRAFAADVDADGRPDIVLVRRDSISWLRITP